MAPTQPPHRVHTQASKLAQLLGETIIHHAPFSGEMSERAKRAVMDEWLENLEAHATSVVGPLIDQITAGDDTPEPIKSLLQHAKSPPKQFGATIQQFFIYGVMFSLASTAMAPFTQGLANDIWHANPTRPLSPADVATMTVRGIAPGDQATTVAPDWAIEIAKQNGLSPEDFQALVSATGNPPAPEDLFQMIRRRIITEDQLTKGIKEGDTRDEWIPYMSKLRYTQASISDMVRAAVQEQLPYDQAAELAAMLGLEPAGYLENNPDWFKIQFDIAGRPPGPVEMGHAANRGFIPWEGAGADELSFQQAIAESDIKTKWTPILKQLAQYFPPPGEVRTLLMHGGITADQAVELWKQGGIPEDLAKAYAHIAQVEQLTQDKELTKGEIMQALQESLISKDEAAAALDKIGYRGDVGNTILELSEWRYNLKILRSSVSRISNLYTSFKITGAEALAGFQALDIPANQAKALLTTLEAQRKAVVVPLTTAQVIDAWEYDIFDQDLAMTYLEQLGMRPFDAWVRLSIKNKGPLPNPPPPPSTEGGGSIG